MKEFLEKIIEKFKGWKTIFSCIFYISVLILYYVYGEIDENLFHQLEGASWFAVIVSILDHWKNGKECHSPDPPQGNR